MLFVCTGNICRSAYADVVARASAQRGVEFFSAGTHAVVGAGLNPSMAAHLRDGVLSRHTARQLSREMIEESDLVVAMDASHRRYIFEEWPDLGRKTFVIGHVARELARLPGDVSLSGLAPHLWQHRSVEINDEVADPFQRGPEAAAVAARAIDAHLSVILPSLGRL